VLIPEVFLIERLLFIEELGSNN
jgi:hypothetical protein